MFVHLEAVLYPSEKKKKKKKKKKMKKQGCTDNRLRRFGGAPLEGAGLAGLIVLVALLLPLDAAAQEAGSPPMVTDRPDATESAVTVAPGTFQLESGYTYGKIEGIAVHNLGEILLRIGVTDSVEVRLGANSYQWVRASRATEQGLEDSTLGVKIKLVDSGGGSGFGSPQVAVLASTTLPTGASLLTQEKVQPEVRFAVAWDLSERFALGTNIVYVYGNDVLVDERFHQGGSTLALGYALTDRVGAYVEYFGVYPVLKDGPSENYVNGGTTFLIDQNFQLDARVGYGLNGLEDDFFVGFGSGVRW